MVLIKSGCIGYTDDTLATHILESNCLLIYFFAKECDIIIRVSLLLELNFFLLKS